MNDNSDEYSRSPLDLLHFGIGFIGFVLSASSVAVGSARLLVLGVILSAIGVGYFLLGGGEE